MFSRSVRGGGSRSTDATSSIRHQRHQGAIYGKGVLTGFDGIAVRRERICLSLPQAKSQRSKNNVSELAIWTVEVELQLFI